MTYSVSAFGYAIETDGEIDVRTVSPTKVGAMVNWLYLNGVTPSNFWADDFVEKVFNETPKQQTFLRYVRITREYV